MFLGKGVPKICSKFIGEYPCRSVISIKLQSNFIEITLRHGCSPVNLLHIFGTPFLKNNSGWLLLKHVGSLMGWFNSNISHRSFIFLFKNGTLKSPNNEILSYKPW